MYAKDRKVLKSSAGTNPELLRLLSELGIRAAHLLAHLEHANNEFLRRLQ